MTRKLQLTRPLVFFDLETTGVNTAKDKIVSIATQKIQPNHNYNELQEDYYEIINPAMEIPESATAIHGISNDDVKNRPFFKDLAPTIQRIFSGCDIAGFNSNNFDIPLLSTEFSRVGTVWPDPGTNFIDVCTIFKLMNSRNLSAAYKRYTGKDMQGAHNATMDVIATIEILQAQIKEHEELPLTVEAIDLMYGGATRVDLGNKFIKDVNNNYIYNFGKNKGETIQKANLHYLVWMLSADFSPETKEWARKIKLTIDNG